MALKVYAYNNLTSIREKVRKYNRFGEHQIWPMGPNKHIVLYVLLENGGYKYIVKTLYVR